MNLLLRIVLICFAGSVMAQNLPLPARSPDAPAGEVFAKKISALNLGEREAAIVQEIFTGNLPAWLRKFCAVTVTNISGGKTNTATFFTAPDYLDGGRGIFSASQTEVVLASHSGGGSLIYGFLNAVKKNPHRSS
jgi:hypothetical protein